MLILSSVSLFAVDCGTIGEDLYAQEVYVIIGKLVNSKFYLRMKRVKLHQNSVQDTRFIDYSVVNISFIEIKSTIVNYDLITMFSNSVIMMLGSVGPNGEPKAK